MSVTKRPRLQILEKNPVIISSGTNEGQNSNEEKSEPEEKMDETGVQRYLGHNDLFAQRYIVTTKGRIKKTGAHSQEVSYFIKSKLTEEVCKLVLTESWALAEELEVDDEISLVGAYKDENSTFFVTRDNGYVIVNPNRLFTVTAIVGQSWCPRKVAIQEIIKGSITHYSAFRGTIAHQFMADAMTNEIKEIGDFERIGEKLMLHFKVREEAYAQGMTEAELRAMVMELIPDVSYFLKIRFKNRGPKQKWEIIEVRDIEDNYWSPTFGIKGKIDATVTVKTSANLVKTVPLEFKTGISAMKGKSRARSDHLGQLILYTLMMRPRYGEVDSGILSYITEDGYNEIDVTLRDLQALIQARNRLERNTRLGERNIKVNVRPDIQFSSCEKCEVRTTCSLLLRKKSADLLPTTDLRTTEKQLLNTIQFLQPTDLRFWETWYDIIIFEAEEGTYEENLSKLWNQAPEERSKTGNCLCNLKLKNDVITPICEDNDVVRYLTSFIMNNQEGDIKDSNGTFIGEGDTVVLSTDTEICIAIATVLEIKVNEIRLCLEDNISHKNVNVYTKFTIDKMIFNSSYKCLLAYLASIMTDTPEATRLREYVVKGKQPIFSKMKKLDAQALTPVVDQLNDDQLKLMSKVLSTDSFLFVKGMPGTGKTYSIVRLLKLLVHQKNSVLLVSYTHSAIDNVLLRYQEGGNNNFVRLQSGRLGEGSLRSRWSSTISKTLSFTDMCQEFISVPIVGTTLMSLSHPIILRRRFDYCIVDEASQALLPSVLGALMVSEKYIIFGDQDQLPPVIKSAEVKNMKISDNIFSHMATPMNTVKMMVQYRMNQKIMDLANKLVYKGQMSCASEEIENRCIDSCVEDKLKNMLKNCPTRSTSGIQKIISGELNNSVLVVNTQNSKNGQESFGDSKVAESYQNTFEADIVTGIVKSFVNGGLNPDSIGVIAPYRAQVHLLRIRMKTIADCYKLETPVEVNTVDQYQGRQKDVIICSFTRSGSTTQDSLKSTSENKGILEDMRRLNVAITRAIKKLILVGDSNTLKEYGPFGKLFTIIPESEHIFINPTDYDQLFSTKTAFT